MKDAGRQWLKDGELQTVTTGAFVRDDRVRLKNDARVLWEWYGRTRRVLDITLAGISGLFLDGNVRWQPNVGQLITSIGSGATAETVNTVISDLSINYSGGTVSLRTAFAELDVTAFE